MKRLTSLAMSLAIMASVAVPASAARVGEVVNYALHTDIVAQINGHSLRSYNVSNRTAIVAEDLAGFGFQVAWDGVKRTLKVERTVDSWGNPVDPAVYPKYEERELEGAIGTRAEAILATDIKTYVAQQPVDAFNIDGETLIWFSDLNRYGQVVWNEASRTANLVLGNPEKGSMEEAVQDWIGENSNYQLYSGTKGTLLVGYSYGAVHGTACKMEYVDLAGNILSINSLLPQHGYGVEYYLNPRNIVVSGDQLSFVTTLAGEGQHQLIVDLAQGKLVSSQPLTGTLTRWEVTCTPEDGTIANTQALMEVVFTKMAGEGEASVLSANFPYDNVTVKADQTGITMLMEDIEDPNYQETPFGRAVRALYKSDLPSRFRDEQFSPENSLEERKLVRKFFRVTFNDKPVAGDLWWTLSNGARALRFDFDISPAIKDGDVLKLSVGVES